MAQDQRAHATVAGGQPSGQPSLMPSGAIVRSPEGWPEPGPFVGREAIMREWEHIREAWNADAVEPISDFIDAGDRVA